jgi:hypothetical protein
VQRSSLSSFIRRRNPLQSQNHFSYEYHFLADGLLERIPRGQRSHVIRAALVAFLAQGDDVEQLAPVEELAELAPGEELAELAPVEELAELAPVEELADLAPVEELAELAQVEELAELAQGEDVVVYSAVDGLPLPLHSPRRQPKEPQGSEALTPAEQLGRLLADLCTITRTSLSLWLQKAASDAVRRIPREGYAPGLYLRSQLGALRAWHTRYQPVGILGYDVQDRVAATYFARYRGLSLPFD